LHPKPPADQSRHRQYFVIVHGQTPTGALQVRLERLFEPFLHVGGLDPISALGIPVRHLDDDERSAMQWAKRLKRVFQIDGETCPNCGGAVQIIASTRDGFAQGLLALSGSLSRPSGEDRAESGEIRPAACCNMCQKST